MPSIGSIKKEQQILEWVFVLKISLTTLIRLEKISFFTVLGVSFYAGLWLFGKQVRGSHMITS